MFWFEHVLGDTSGQSEPLLSSFDEPPTAVSIISQHGYTLVKEDEHNLIAEGPDTPVFINYEVRETSYIYIITHIEH